MENQKCKTVVLCSKGLLGIIKNIQINNLNKIKINKNNFVFHAGTKIESKKIISIGGRVLNFTSLGYNYKIMRMNIIKSIKIKLEFRYLEDILEGTKK